MRGVRLVLIGSLLAAVIPIAPAAATVSGQEGKVAFVSDRDGNQEIYVMGSDGSDQVNLSHDSDDDYEPDWSPDGQRIAFVSDRDGEPAVYLMDGDGSDQDFLVFGFHPAWSPDGSELLVTRSVPDPATGDEVTAIWAIGADGRNLRRLTDPSAVYFTDPTQYASDRYPAWMPDGSGIVFQRHTPNSPCCSRREVMTLPIGGGIPVRSTVIDDASGPGDVSPDGYTLVVFSADSNTGVGGLILIDIGTGQISLTTVFGSGLVAPSWSPTMNRIVLSGGGTGGSHDVLVFEPAKDTLTNLTNTAGSDDTDPDWQPVNPYPMGLVATSQGLWHLRDATGAVESFYFGDPGDVPFLGDWDCDGVDTPGLYRQSDGFVYLRNSNSQGIAHIRFFFGNPGDVPLAGDFDGDGCDTVSIYRPSEARFYIINALGSNDGGLGAAEVVYLFGDGGDTPFVGDFDGDDVDTVGLHRVSTGLVYLRNSHTAGNADVAFVFGDPGDHIVAGDWNGDGSDSPGLYRPSTNTHYFRFSNSAGPANAHFIWGDPAWIPVAGAFSHG